MVQKPTVLCILDGFGYSPQNEGNAIFEAKTPTLDLLWSSFPSYLLKAAEEEVGLEFGEIGNSEVGHITIGTGRVIPQSLNRINKSLEDGTYFQNQGFLKAINHVKMNNSALHILGIISTAGVHGHLFHFTGVLKLAAQQGLSKVYLHLILDGRDSGKFDSPMFLKEIEKLKNETGVGIYASICGRAYAMDRNNNWEKTQEAYNLLFGKAPHTYPTPNDAIAAYYHQQIDDESIPPTIISSGNEPISIQKNDAVIFTNFREDRARQLTEALSYVEFSKFPRDPLPENLLVVTMTQYQKSLPVVVAFPPAHVTETLSDSLSQNGLSQIHIAETEKYAHVTYFFNGGREEKTTYEEFHLIPSYKPDEFITHPEMSATQIADAVIASLDLGYNFIVFNFANCDMVAHTGDYQATVKAVEYIDIQVKRVWEAIWAKQGDFFLTADHGNSEQMLNPKTGEIYKKHTISPVPFIIAKPELYKSAQSAKIMSNGKIAGLLSDIAPTILTSLRIPVPAGMNGTSLL